MRKDEFIGYVIHKYKEKQLVKAMEELGELNSALARIVNDLKPDYDNFEEELCDVIFMCEQLLWYFDIPDETVEARIQQKIDKFLEWERNEERKKL
ncbi:MAG: hypothetical protein KBS59_01440 [Clostridiales bacterium]|nr:hypothetical protein [Clostridiales bacterium]